MPRSFLKNLIASAALGATAFGLATATTAQPTAQTVRIDPTQVAFDTGMDALEAGDYVTAIRAFSAILAQRPDLVRVRLELARAYFEAEQYSRARAEFFNALSADLPPAVRANVLRYIRQIDARRGFEWDLTVALTSLGSSRNYDSDVVYLGADELPFTLNREDTSEIGLRVSGNVGVRKPFDWTAFGQPVVGFARADLAASQGQNVENDDLIVSGQAGMRIASPLTTSAAYAVLRDRWTAGDAYETAAGLGLSSERRTQAGLSVFGSLTATSLDNHQRDDLDGAEYGAIIGLRKSLRSRGQAGVSLSVARKDVDYDLENALTTRLSGYVDINVTGGWRVRPSVFIESKTFPTPSPLFNGNPDEFGWGGDLRVEKTDFFLARGFTPFGRVGYRRMESGLDAYSYDETSFSVGLDRRF